MEALSKHQAYWDQRWRNGETQWDIHGISPAIQDYINTIENKNSKILIPGCGNAYEAKYFLMHGFTDITLVDISPTLCQKLEERYGDIPEIQIRCTDFFDLEPCYDILLEHTFLSSMPPDLRTKYPSKVHELLCDGGRLFGLLFDTQFPFEGPPYGGSADEYEELFSPYFKTNIQKSERSIAPRAGNEVFVVLHKK